MSHMNDRCCALCVTCAAALACALQTKGWVFDVPLAASLVDKIHAARKAAAGRRQRAPTKQKGKAAAAGRVQHPAPKRARKSYTAAQRTAMCTAVSTALALLRFSVGVVGQAYQALQSAVTKAPYMLPKPVADLAVSLLRAGDVLPGVEKAGTWLGSHNAHRDVRYWWRHWCEHGHLGQATSNRPGRRKYNVTAAELDACIEGIIDTHVSSVAGAGWMVPAMRDVIKRTRIPVKYLWRQMKARVPQLGSYMRRWCKSQLTRQQRIDRVDYCRSMLSHGGPRRRGGGVLRYLMRVLWIDQKIVYTKPATHSKLLGLSGARGVAPHPSLLYGRHYQGWCLYYYSCVNGYLGPVALRVMVPGTRGPQLQKPKYLVSATHAYTTRGGPRFDAGLHTTKQTTRLFLAN